MAWYPDATRMELQPESDQQPAIRPTQMIVHSIAAPWTVQRLYEYWKSSSLESHFGLAYDGDLAQYIGTETRADANAGANHRSDGTGAVSVETASNTSASDPWTPEQVEQLVLLGVWLHQRHGIPLRICRTHDDPGYGYHSLYPQWSTSGTACPGTARIRQFHEVVVPGIITRATNPPNEENNMALTNDDIRNIWLTDGIITNPNPDSVDENPFIPPATGLRNIEIVTRRTEASLAALQATNDTLVQAVAQLASNIGNLDPTTIVAELKAAIESISIHLTAG